MVYRSKYSPLRSWESPRPSVPRWITGLPCAASTAGILTIAASALRRPRVMDSLLGRSHELPWGGRAVPIRRRVVLLPLRAVGERVQADGPVQRQDAVEVVDLVLHQLRHGSLKLDHTLLASRVEIPHRHLVGPGHPYEQVGERETVVPHREILGPDIHDLGVQHRGPLAVGVDQDHADGSADLSRGKRPTDAVAPPGRAQRIPQVVRDQARRGRDRGMDVLCPKPKGRVAEQTDAPGCHGTNVAICRGTATRLRIRTRWPLPVSSWQGGARRAWGRPRPCSTSVAPHSSCGSWRSWRSSMSGRGSWLSGRTGTRSGPRSPIMTAWWWRTRTWQAGRSLHCGWRSRLSTRFSRRAC